MREAEPIRVLVDSDGGIDDIAALWYLLERPDVDLVGITVTGGNVGVRTAADNLARVTHLAGRSAVPIALGVPGPLGPCPDLRPATFVHGDDGVGNTGRRPPPWEPHGGDAVDLLADAICRDGPLTLLTLGPLTNVGRFVERHPDLVAAVGDVVVMGGAVAVQGNALPTAEANIAHDPVAAARVAAAGWTRPPLLVPLDVTLAATLGPTELDLLRSGATSAGQDLDAPLAFYAGAGSTFSPPGEMPCHDLTAAIVAVEPELVDAPELPLGVDTGGGFAWGSTVVDRRRPFFDAAGAANAQAAPDGLAPWRVALGADVAGIRARYRWLFAAAGTRAPTPTTHPEVPSG